MQSMQFVRFMRVSLAWVPNITTNFVCTLFTDNSAGRFFIVAQFSAFELNGEDGMKCGGVEAGEVNVYVLLLDVLSTWIKLSETATDYNTY